LFSTNKETDLLTIEKNGKPLIGNESIYASAVWDENNNEVILKLVNSSNTQKSTDIVLKTKKRFISEAKVQLLTNNDLKAYNTIDNPEIVKPMYRVLNINGKNVKIDLEPYSLTVIKLKQK
jgi:alpha-L-arabinofuranosidase